MILNDAEIEAKMQECINNTYPPAMREKAMRLGGLPLDELNAFFTSMSVLKAQWVAERDAELAAYLASLPVVEVAANPIEPIPEIV